MFNNIPQPILDRMRLLEQLDARDRHDDTPRLLRLRQIPPETGKFIALLAASAPPGEIIEIGTSAGYSTLWLSLAREQRAGRIVTFEIMPEKSAMARETFRAAGLEEHVQLIAGDARFHLRQREKIAFCFLDAEKDVYDECYESVVPGLVHGGLLVADNVISHREELAPFLGKVLNDPRVDVLVVPIGSGALVCRKL